jgi:hypothetical protein
MSGFSKKLCRRLLGHRYVPTAAEFDADTFIGIRDVFTEKCYLCKSVRFFFYESQL